MNPTLHEVLATALAASPATGLCVAFSGGPDSSALLHALAHTPDARACGLRALHVDHGLHSASADWAKHCADFCASLDVPLTTVRVDVENTRGEGIEAAARRARYAVFANELRDGEWLALAHHRDDQVETVLLKLLRGAGPEGLGGMRVLRPLARGFLWRPLLEIPREVLRIYLIDNGISSIDDPANGNPRFARNVLRQEILPRITRHWPYAAASILHSARRNRDTADYLGNAAATALASLRRDAGTLDATGWLALPDALRGSVLDAWLHARGLPAPHDAARGELARQTARAAPDRVPRVAWAGAEVRVWDGRLHAMPPLIAPPSDWCHEWNGAPLELPPDCGILTLETADARHLPTRRMRFTQSFQVSLRRGGEHIRPTGNLHVRELRNLFQQARIPPWLRSRTPLIYAGDELIAVADLWISDKGWHALAPLGVLPHWERPAWA